ncbi:MAG: GIY-YIG nuclease family protein [Candidatus Marinimicrobia bacterium]|nr:GIY-YIG nuclease family protein [Candidatus Neomarinimicrobiota bacterium]MBT4036377.1 GIY-YIG nuclease family protein [Candidatus Neomarinimicrobiota bacterium]MBT4361266.1 GIY-YIG nuclease family protein [Candidatus Neomarinimicrobiota bacterium]MBT4716099.1 GIY-YIG nuclease family protein [Candidatus Neomarinimicrobiota bacterium]MBT4945231.1 GIY-YIG nuclease family protein [Candidatus Neomarinimicrobiota bacterium]
MHYVYILQSVSHPERFYTGRTSDVNRRLAEHNRHKNEFTSRYKPWILKTYIAFTSKDQAIAFEKYLKSPSGRAFAKKRL